eukprot:scaffold4891_cov140-Cylindrotheca_fusiformis.AAC.6
MKRAYVTTKVEYTEIDSLHIPLENIPLIYGYCRSYCHRSAYKHTPQASHVPHDTCWKENTPQALASLTEFCSSVY